MKKFIKNNLFGFLIGIILCSGVVYGVSYNAKDISYVKEDGTQTKVNEALDYLYNNDGNNLKINEVNFNSGGDHNCHIIFDISETSYTKIKFNSRIGANTPKTPTISFSEDLTNWTDLSITVGNNYEDTYNEFSIPENTKYVKCFWQTGSGRAWFNNLSFE